MRKSKNKSLAMKTKENYCTSCEEVVKFINSKCEKCKSRYDDVVPASYRDYEYDFLISEK